MTDDEGKLAALREAMVRDQLRARGIVHAAVLQAFSDVPRHLFMSPSRLHEAYGDFPVPIGHGQTISQPYIVALMVQELDPQADHRVLDVGSGSGYQTAILAQICRWVYAIERIGDLTERAVGLLAELNASNVTFRTGDGSLGWPEEAPFDRIICGAGAPDVPQPWVDQLADGGRIVLPVGGPDYQSLLVVDKRGDNLLRRHVCDVRFVPLIGQAAWPY